MSSFHQISLMSTALRAFQRELDVTGQNITNVETKGYSRQNAVLSTRVPTITYEGRALSIGNGVSVAGINRVRDMFLEARRLDAGSEQGRLGAEQDAMSKIESLIVDASGNGISDALNKFWDAWSGLASNPNQSALKLQVQNAGATLAKQIRTTYANLDASKLEAEGAIKASLGDLQQMANTLSSLNEEIRVKSADGSMPNDLLDRRDAVMRDIASIADVDLQKFSDGSYVVSMGGLPIVGQFQAFTIPSNFDPATNTLSDANGTYTIHSGQIRGLMDSINKVTSYQSRLDTLANGLRTEVNNLHMSGVNQAGATGLRFFNDVASGPQTGAIDFALDTVGVTGPPASAGVGTDPNAIATGTSGNASDGALALSLSRLRAVAIPAFGNVTAGSFFANLVSDVGNDSNAAQMNLDTQLALVEQVDNQIQSVSGVSLDDEMANMLRFQRSYQAAAKALSTFDSLMDDLLAMVR